MALVPVQLSLSWRGGLPAFATFGALCVLLLGVGRLLSSRRDVGPAALDRSSGMMEVRRVSVAFDWNARAALQQSLDAAAGRYDLNSEGGLAGALRDVRETLEEALPSAQYGLFNRVHATEAEAEGTFVQTATELRSRFTEETVRNKFARAFGEMRARPEEGEGLVVVSLVVASSVHLPALPQALDRDSLARALRSCEPQFASALVALEVIWSPSEDADRMSSAELEALYPELIRLDENSAVGRLACGYCRAPYARELGRCPSCGAPA